MVAAAVEAALDSALLTDSEFAGGPESWGAFEDPFRLWERLLAAEAAAGHDHEEDEEEEEGDDEEGEGEGDEPAVPVGGGAGSSDTSAAKA